MSEMKDPTRAYFSNMPMSMQARAERKLGRKNNAQTLSTAELQAALNPSNEHPGLFSSPSGTSIRLKGTGDREKPLIAASKYALLRKSGENKRAGGFTSTDEPQGRDFKTLSMVESKHLLNQSGKDIVCHGPGATVDIVANGICKPTPTHEAERDSKSVVWGL